MKIAADERITYDTFPYDFGLAEILQLLPLVYKYKGNDTNTQPSSGATVPYQSSPHYSQAVSKTTEVGLNLQQVEQAVENYVVKRKGYIDGMLVTDLREIDTEPLLFMLVNAVRELAQRLDALDGGGNSEPTGDTDGRAEQRDEEGHAEQHSSEGTGGRASGKERGTKAAGGSRAAEPGAAAGKSGKRASGRAKVGNLSGAAPKRSANRRKS